MTKSEFIDRLLLAAEAARRVGAAQPYVKELLSDEPRFTLMQLEESADGKIKYLGGRFVTPDELVRLTAGCAGTLLWVDGKVPAWINIGVVNCTDTFTEYQLMFSRTLRPANPELLRPDINMEPGNKYVPFRIRGPSEGDWAKRKTDA